MTEFQAYGKLKKKVEQLVNDDIDADKFFNSLNKFSNIRVRYIDKIEKVLDKYDVWSNEDFIIFPTTIQIRDIVENDTSTHSILLIWNKSKLYLYDPNGVYNTAEELYYKISNEHLQQSYGYVYEDNYFDSTQDFHKFVKNTYNIQLKIPTDLGAQYLLPIEGDNTSYISSGGYCMFFNYMVIEYIANNMNEPFNKIYKAITKYPFNNVFPRPATEDDALNGTAHEDTFEGKTVQITKDVFSNKGGKRKTKYKRKNTKRITRKKLFIRTYKK